MKLSRMLATATVCSTLLFSATGANAKSRHKSKAAAAAAAKPADTSADADAANSPSANSPSDDTAGGGGAATTTTTTTTTTNDDDSSTTTTDQKTEAPADTNTAAPEAVVPPVSTPPVESPATPTIAPAPVASHKIVFLPMVSSTERAEHGYSPPLGVVVSAGGGAFDFVGGDLKNMTGMGGFWTVRALVGSRSIVALEGTYIGTAQTIQALGLQTNARLLSNGVQGALRVNAPIAIGKMFIEPFGFAGGGWSHYSLVSTNTQSASLQSTDNVITLPVGAGLAMGYNGFFFDARASYTFSYENNLVVSPTVNPGMDTWNAGGTLGFEF